MAGLARVLFLALAKMDWPAGGSPNRGSDMIYLFCNAGYGRPFQDAALTFCRRHGLALTLVYSVPDPARVGPSRRRLSGLRSFWGIQRQQWRWRRQLGVPVLLVPSVNAPAFGRRIRPGDLGVVAGFNQIFREGVIRRFRQLVNFHPSLLPLYRGPVPSYWCLHFGEQMTGFTLHEITGRIDAGPLLFQEVVAIAGIQDPGELDQRIALQAAPQLPRYLETYCSGRPWQPVLLDARAIYRTSVEYASFPDRGVVRMAD